MGGPDSLCNMHTTTRRLHTQRHLSQKQHTSDSTNKQTKPSVVQARTAAEQARRGQAMEQEWQRLAAVVENGIVHGMPAQAAADGGFRVSRV